MKVSEEWGNGWNQCKQSSIDSRIDCCCWLSLPSNIRWMCFITLTMTHFPNRRYIWMGFMWMALQWIERNFLNIFSWQLRIIESHRSRQIPSQQQRTSRLNAQATVSNCCLDEITLTSNRSHNLYTTSNATAFNPSLTYHVLQSDQICWKPPQSNE
jgi:hypothetical protein